MIQFKMIPRQVILEEEYPYLTQSQNQLFNLTDSTENVLQDLKTKPKRAKGGLETFKLFFTNTMFLLIISRS